MDCHLLDFYLPIHSLTGFALDGFLDTTFHPYRVCMYRYLIPLGIFISDVFIYRYLIFTRFVTWRKHLARVTGLYRLHYPNLLLQ